MKRLLLFALPILMCTSCATRTVRSASDITPENCGCERLDWTYGAGDIRIQSRKICGILMDRWHARAGASVHPGTKPKITVAEVDNRTDQYISTDMIRDIIEGVAVQDGRFTITVGDCWDEQELDQKLIKIQSDSKYAQSQKPAYGRATAPEFLAKIRITKAVTRDNRYDYEDYRMTVTLYDLETQELVDSAWDVLQKRVQG